MSLTPPAHAQGAPPGFGILMRAQKLHMLHMVPVPEPVDPFQKYYNEHPDFGKELQEFVITYKKTNPKSYDQAQNKYLLLNPKWRARQPRELNEFLQRHPDAWKAALSAVQYYWTPEFSKFMDDKPKLAAELRNNPELMYDDKWLAKNPKVKAFLRTHRDVLCDVYSSPHFSGAKAADSMRAH
ncbi:MAG TPA: hypothetical protein VMU16_06105 [Candidatus Binataceae bacterium]|nr:hypothetical protein [Candidatus Binataceae bacterium]